VTSVSLPNSPIDIQLRLMWRLLRLVFWLSVVTALLYAVANVQRGHWVLDYERLEAGAVRLDAIEFSLRDLTGSAVAMFGAQAEAKQLSLSLDLTDGLPDA